jgi:nucleoside-diphosphate-sugar epimerase
MVKHFTILGGRGYIGSFFARFLDRQGIPYAIPERGVPAPSERELGCVVYCIGMTQDFANRPLETMDAHVSNLISVLRGTQFQSLIYLSSTRLFDGLNGIATEQSDLHLNPNNPRHLFDLSKAAGEAICCAMTDVDAISVRLSTVYDDDLVGRCFIHDIVRRSTAPGVGPIDVDTSEDMERDYVHIDDVCGALLLLSGRHSSRIYNLASGVNISNHELFELIRARTGRVLRASRRGAGLPVPSIDVSRMKDEFDWRPRQVADWLAAVLQDLPIANGSKASD